jgi:LysM repeat protein
MVKIILLIAGLNAWGSPADSLRLETINGQTFIVHLVGDKETLYSLSRRYGVTVARVLEFNSNADAGLESGQLLKIPYVPRTRTQTAEGTVHKVQAKETLFSISRMYSVSVEDIKAWNNLRDNALSVGQELLVKKKAAGVAEVRAEPKAVDTRPAEAKSVKMTHTVTAGETLYALSRTYGVSVQQLRTWNSLTSDELKAAQVLYVAQPMFQQQAETTPKSPTQPVQITRQDPPTNTTASTQPTAGSPVKISETVLGTDEVHELGIAELIDGSEGNRKYLALHRTAKTGSILKVRNELNNREVFVRVAGPLPNTGVNDKIVIKLSRSAYDRLGAVDPKFRVEVTYYK